MFMAVANLATMIPTIAIRPCTAKTYSESDIERGRSTFPTLVVNNDFNWSGTNAYLEILLGRELALAIVYLEKKYNGLFEIRVYESTPLVVCFHSS